MTIKSPHIERAVRIAVGAGNPVREITAGWTKVHQVVHMRDVLVLALRDDIQREVPSLRYWSTEGTPHNAPEEGFLCDEYGVGLVFPTKWTPAPGHKTYTMTEPRRENPSRKLLLLEQPYATVSHDESTARAAVVAGLTSGMDYWAGLAVGWIESGLPLDTQLAELLLKIAELRHMPQQLRHRAFALAKRWQKSIRAEFIDVQWRHGPNGDPTRLVSELDEKRMETRKLEFFEDGRVGYATTDRTAHGTELSPLPVPPLAEINADPEFVGTNITAAEFEALWFKHVPL